ncbi:MAG: sigma 54-interacting transcriptional regulator [Ignavibacteriales bacterium]|nr:sigma 54-interacting transcriptional regulator [Ignavibacteriales bacterium]
MLLWNCSAFVETLIESELFGHEAGSFHGSNKEQTGKI